MGGAALSGGAGGYESAMDLAARAVAAKSASRALASAGPEEKAALLRAVAAAIAEREAEILEANGRDLAAAEAAGLAAPKLARLRLTPASLAQMRAGLEQIAAMPDPVHATTREWTTDAGLRVKKVRCPLGVVCMIYEARPGVTVDAFALCFKAGNACILKGGREANESNRALAAIVRERLAAAGLPEDAIVQITTSDREEIKRLLTLDQHIDLVIPRGGTELIRFVAEHSRIPTIQHFHGVCHVYVDRAADLDMALDIVATAKTSAPATCNSAECVLVHADVAQAFLPRLAERLHAEGVTLRADERSRASIPSPPPNVEPAGEEDWGREYLDLVLACRVVDSIDGAIDHIRRHASDHTETIVTGDAGAAERFLRDVQSSCVLHNASTRFNDGFSLGLGAEIGISTTRVHAYGPMGVEQLTTERFVVLGSGQTR